MPDTATPQDWPALLIELRKLTGLIGPLEAILAQEEAPALSDKIEQFIQEVTSIRHLLTQAVGNLELNQDTRSMITEIKAQNNNLTREMSALRAQMQKVSHLLNLAPN